MKSRKTETELLSLIAQMREDIGALGQRVHELEQRLGEGAALAQTGIDEETLLAISGAVAAFLGVQARVRNVRLLHSSAWAQVGRIGVHASHRIQ
jgi:hypothetical protein